MSRPTSNSSVTVARPCWLEDEMSTMPSTLIHASSTSSTTSVSIVSGDAPSRVNDTVTCGKSTSGIWLTPSSRKPRAPNTIRPAINIHAKTGFRTAASESLICRPSPRPSPRPTGRSPAPPPPRARAAALPAAGSTTATAVPSARTLPPRTTIASPSFRPATTSTSPSRVRRPSVSTRAFALPSSTTNASQPFSPGCRAASGTAIARARFVSTDTVA